jgi:KH domain
MRHVGGMEVVVTSFAVVLAV